MNILVAGGTGFIGKKIVETLTSQDNKVFVLTRNKDQHRNSFTEKMLSWLTGILPTLLCFQKYPYSLS